MAQLLEPTNVEWAQVHFCLDEYGRTIKGIPDDKRSVYLRTLANEAKDKSATHDADVYTGMAWLAQLIASNDDMNYSRRLGDARVKAFIARKNRAGSSADPAFGKLCEALSVDLFDLGLNDADKQVVSNMLRDIANQTWGDSYPSHFKHYTQRAMDTTASPEERRKANLCMSLMLAMDASPLGNNQARALLVKVFENRNAGDSDEESSAEEDAVTKKPSGAPVPRLDLNMEQFSNAAFGRALLETVTFAAGLRMRPRKRRQAPATSSPPRGPRRMGNDPNLEACRQQ